MSQDAQDARLPTTLPTHPPLYSPTVHYLPSEPGDYTGHNHRISQVVFARELGQRRNQLYLQREVRQDHLPYSDILELLRDKHTYLLAVQQEEGWQPKLVEQLNDKHGFMHVLCHTL